MWDMCQTANIALVCFLPSTITFLVKNRLVDGRTIMCYIMGYKEQKEKKKQACDKKLGNFFSYVLE